MRKWVLSFGSDAEVLEPVEMREEIRAELARTLAAYKKNATNQRQ